MPKISNYNLEDLNLQVSPLNPNNTDFIRLVNMEDDGIGVKKKRPGYATFLGTPDNSTVNSLFDWHFQDGTTMYLYRATGGTLYYSSQGTGAWTICGNGTFTAGSPVGNTVIDGTLLLCGDGVANTRHSTTGTSFVDTTAAPKATNFEEYQLRAYALGTANNLVYATTGTPTDWTTDSTSITIPGAGRNRSLMKVANRLVATKTSKEMYRWDGYSLLDMSTKLGPSSDQSIGEIENYKIYLNQLGIFGFNGDTPDIVSNPIERLVYNDSGSAISGGYFGSAAGVAHQYNYLVSVGTITDNLTKQTTNNAILNYDYQRDNSSEYAFGTPQTAWLSYLDETGVQRLIFGDNNGQCYTFGGTATTDNGLPIQAEMEIVFHGGDAAQEKKFNQLWLSFSPGCQAHVQVAFANTFTRETLNWVDVGDVSDGFKEFRFPSGSQSRLMFLRIIETSRNARFAFYGYEVDFDWVVRR